MITRSATMKDKPAILRLAKEQTTRYPRLRSDVEKINGAVAEVIADSRHFTQVVEVDGQVEGVLVGITADALWSQRKNCMIALWVSKVPGGGVQLLRGFRDWVKSGRSIKFAGMAPDLDLDPRTYWILKRIGFERHGGTFLLYN